MKRYDDVMELLEDVSFLTGRIAAAYSASRTEGAEAICRPQIKSAVEHLRSCLDYCAQDISEMKTGRRGEKIYFPYGETEELFHKSVQRNIPGLQTKSPQVYSLLENLQPHRSDSPWLVQLCKDTNQVKHGDIRSVQQVNSDDSALKIGRLAELRGDSRLVLVDCFVNGVPVGHEKPAEFSRSISIDEMRASLPAGVDVGRRYDWVEFRFPTSGLDALTLIRKSSAHIKQFCSDLRPLLS